MSARLALVALLSALLLGAPAPARAGHTVLGNDVLRIDFAPTDFSILNSGAIGGTRGLYVAREGGANTVGMGLGVSYGFTGRAEAGVLFLPLELSDGDYGDITVHGRYRLLFGTFELAVQAALRIPTDSSFGFGLGAPIVLHLSSVDIETGVEVEVTTEPGVANLDVPVTLLFNITRNVYAGVRTGIFAPNFDALDIGLGAVAGAHIFATRSLSIDPIASFLFPRFVTTGAAGPLELGAWLLQVGFAVHLRL